MNPSIATEASVPVQPNERIAALDVLRGIALMGMIVVHFFELAPPAGEESKTIIQQGLELFGYGLFFTMFAILFGIGFAIQLERANQKGVRFVPRYLRRLLALFCFGLVADGIFGVNVLIEYSLCGLLLLLVRNWPAKALLALALAITMLYSLYFFTSGSISAAVNGVEKTKEMKKQATANAMVYWKEKNRLDSVARNTTSFSTTMVYNTKKVIHRYSALYPVVFVWLSKPFLLFLIGLLAVRKGVFTNLKRHKKLIIGFMIFGLISWSVDLWRNPLFTIPAKYNYPQVSYSIELLLRHLSFGLFGLLSYDWLAFTYMGVVLLVSAYFKRVHRFRIFTQAGRMSMTIYMTQAVFLKLLFLKSGFGVGAMPDVIRMTYALAFFSMLVLFSRWWLTHYQYGPLEWVWRSVTYWKLQPMRKMDTQESTVNDAQRSVEVVPVAVPVSNKP